MYKILAKEDLNPITRRFDVYAPDVARKAQAGQFIIVHTHEKGERIPLTVMARQRMYQAEERQALELWQK